MFLKLDIYFDELKSINRKSTNAFKRFSTTSPRKLLQKCVRICYHDDTQEQLNALSVVNKMLDKRRNQ